MTVLKVFWGSYWLNMSPPVVEILYKKIIILYLLLLLL